MITLTSEIKRLLDRLYNLRSEDSVILASIEENKAEAETTLDRTSAEKQELQDKIAKLTSEEGLLKEQSSRLLEVLSGINAEDFSLVLSKLNIAFNPREMEEKLNTSLPEMLDKVVDETTKAKDELKNVEEQMHDAITKIEELGIRKDTAIANQQKLNEYFELALNGNLNITRDSISSLLEQFDFTLDEQKEAAKLLMFPEDALYEYDQETKGGKTISEVFAEAKNYNETKANEEQVVSNGDKKEELLSLMKKCGLDYLDYTGTDLEKIANNYNEEVVTSNINYIKQNNMALDLFSDNVELLYDAELIAKIERIFSLGKTSIDIYLNPMVLKKYSLASLEEAISNLEKNGLDPKMVPLMAY